MQKILSALSLISILNPLSAVALPSPTQHPMAARSPARPAARPPARVAARVAGKPQAHAAKAKRSTPTDFISDRAQKILTLLKSRPLRGDGVVEIRASASKSAWLQSVYDKNLVETSWATQMLSDKRLLFAVLEREMGARATQFYPKTLGLREFLSKKRLLDPKGNLVADGDRIDKELHDEFPAGFIVRPAVGVAPQETGRGLFASSDDFIIELLRPGTALYAAGQLSQPVRSHILQAIASGEAVVLQENFINVSAIKHPLKNKIFQEVRVHTYEQSPVEGAVPRRWVQSNLLSPQEITAAEAFVAEFLKALPVAITSKQAWGIDVAVLDNGDLRINDVVTNRGRQIPWSSYLDQPRVIGAYTRHFERDYAVRFKGIGGTLIRHDFANYMPYWGKRIEKAKPGFSKALAYLPPLP